MFPEWVLHLQNFSPLGLVSIIVQEVATTWYLMNLTLIVSDVPPGAISLNFTVDFSLQFIVLQDV